MAQLGDMLLGPGEVVRGQLCCGSKQWFINMYMCGSVHMAVVEAGYLFHFRTSLDKQERVELLNTPQFFCPAVI